MTNRQRIINALNHKESDMIPYYTDYTQDCRARLVEYFGDKDFESRYRRMIVGAEYGARFAPVPGKPGRVSDIFGVVWNRSVDKDIGVIEDFLIPEIEGWDYTFPEVDEREVRACVDILAGDGGDRFRLFELGFTVFERAWTLCGMENILTAMALYPKELDRLLDAICDYNLRLIDIALERSECIDGVYFGDDWGQQKNLIMGPAHWRRFIKPRFKKMYSRVKDKGLYVLQHSCGDIGAVYEDLVEIGLDCHQTFQPEIYDIGQTKKNFGGRLAFWGGISTQQLLATATPAETRAETIRIMRVMGRGGGYIASPTHSVPGDVPPENIEAMLDVFENQVKYL